MDFSSSPFFTPDFVYDDGLDFSSFSSPSTFQEPNPSIPITHTENDGKQIICEITKMGDELKNKRMKHREIEKQRRQEVTLLFKHLRHILPSQYIKGKRSTSAHVEETVNYIKDLQKKIKELSEKRDKIMRSITHPSSTRECSGRSLESSSSSSSSSLSSNCCCVGDTHIDVVVRACLNGIEVVASCCFRYKSCLSNVLQVLAQEQCFNVVSCISTRLHKKIIHTIISEVEEGIEVYFSELQEKITKMGTRKLSS